MKEVTAIIRLNKVTETKQKLAAGGFPGFTCRKVFGRGKNPLIGRDFPRTSRTQRADAETDVYHRDGG